MAAVRGKESECSHSCGGEVLRLMFLDVSHETLDVTPCRTSPPMPLVCARLVRSALCNTRSHLTAAGCT